MILATKRKTSTSNMSKIKGIMRNVSTPVKTNNFNFNIFTSVNVTESIDTIDHEKMSNQKIMETIVVKSTIFITIII